MAYAATELADCSTISKAFERGAAYSVTPESVYAMMTPVLNPTRVQSAGIINQIENEEALTAQQTTDQKIEEEQGASPGLAVANAVEVRNMDKADEEDEGFVQSVIGNFVPGDNGEVEGTGNTVDAEIFGNIFNSKCIPCGERLNLLGELNFKTGLTEYLQHWKQWLMNHYQNLLRMLDIFKGVDKYVDLCVLLNYLKTFVCVPDLARMLSALMALMNQSAFEFNGVLDLIMQLVAPLVQPFLSNFVNMLQKYILMVIKPLECIIDSIQGIIAKLDYNVLFRNIDSLDKHVSIGRRQGAKTGTTGKNISKIPFIDVQVDLHEGPERSFEADYNTLDTLTAGSIKRKNAQDQKAVDKASDELRAIQSAGKNVDASNPAEVERYKQQREAASQKLRNAKKEKNLSELGELNRNIEDFQQGFKSSIYSLIGYLRKAAQAVEGFFQDVFGELQKIMGEYFGGSGNWIQMLHEKLQLVQMIEWISAIIKAFSSDLHCNDDEEDIRIERLVPAQQGTFVWTDDEGNVHIEEDPSLIDTAVNETVKALGAEPSGDGGVSPGDADKGSQPTDQTARQKLKGLIEFTGDPVLDTSIARATEALTTPVSAVFKCPLQTTVQEAEQVNTWIQELNTT
jgi:hypothetical protein